MDNNYYRPREEELLQEYLKAVDYLTINNENRLEKKVEELTQKQDDISHETRTKTKRQRLKELEKSIHATRMAQQKHQELLEALWLHQQEQQSKEEESDDKKYNIPKVAKYILKAKGRNLTQGGDKEQEFEAKSFILMNNNDYHNIPQDVPLSSLSEEEIERMPWTFTNNNKNNNQAAAAKSRK